MTRLVLIGRSCTSRVDMLSVSYRSDICSLERSSSAMPGPAGVDGLLGAVLLGGEADRGRLDAQRQVLRDDRDVEAVVGEVERDREDAGVVVAELQPGGQHRHVRVVELDAQRTAASPTAIGKSRRSCWMRSSSRLRSAWRAKYPISGSWRFASSSVTTTTGSTTECSANRKIDFGSLSRTEVSST